MAYTLIEAAKATGKSKATIASAIRIGRISAVKDDAGTFHIDPAEMHRIYPRTVYSEHTATAPDIPEKTGRGGGHRTGGQQTGPQQTGLQQTGLWLTVASVTRMPPRTVQSRCRPVLTQHLSVWPRKTASWPICANRYQTSFSSLLQRSCCWSPLDFC